MVQFAPGHKTMWREYVCIWCFSCTSSS